MQVGWGREIPKDNWVDPEKLIFPLNKQGYGGVFNRNEKIGIEYSSLAGLDNRPAARPFEMLSDEMRQICDLIAYFSKGPSETSEGILLHLC